jgi:hypothetical protein
VAHRGWRQEAERGRRRRDELLARQRSEECVGQLGLSRTRTQTPIDGKKEGVEIFSYFDFFKKKSEINMIKTYL